MTNVFRQIPWLSLVSLVIGISVGLVLTLMPDGPTNHHQEVEPKNTHSRGGFWVNTPEGYLYVDDTRSTTWSAAYLDKPSRIVTLEEYLRRTK